MALLREPGLRWTHDMALGLLAWLHRLPHLPLFGSCVLVSPFSSLHHTELVDCMRGREGSSQFCDCLSVCGCETFSSIPTWRALLCCLSLLGVRCSERRSHGRRHTLRCDRPQSPRRSGCGRREAPGPREPQAAQTGQDMGIYRACGESFACPAHYVHRLPHPISGARRRSG